MDPARGSRTGGECGNEQAARIRVICAAAASPKTRRPMQDVACPHGRAHRVLRSAKMARCIWKQQHHIKQAVDYHALASVYVCARAHLYIQVVMVPIPGAAVAWWYDSGVTGRSPTREAQGEVGGRAGQGHDASTAAGGVVHKRRGGHGRRFRARRDGQRVRAVVGFEHLRRSHGLLPSAAAKFE